MSENHQLENHKANEGDPANRQGNNLIIITGEKGGVGKSFVARILIEYFLRRGWKKDFILIDADPSIGDVSAIFKCETLTFSDSKFKQGEPLKIFREVQNKNVIVNLPSNISRQVNDWMESNGFLNEVLDQETKAIYKGLYFFFVSDGCYHSVEQFKKHVKFYPQSWIYHLLVLNPGRLTQAGDFDYLEQDKELMELLRDRQLPVLRCPELSTDLQFKCDKLKKTYEEVSQQKNLDLLDKQRIKWFLQNIEQFFHQLFGENVADLRWGNLVEEQKENREKLKLPIPSARPVITAS